MESDDLSNSRTGLPNGYGQTKYVSEYLIREAAKRGLSASIVRSGYIGGDSQKGLAPTDDFLLRMLKGSIQLDCAPELGGNTINVVPVLHCARIVVAAALRPGRKEGVVLQVTSHPQIPFRDFLGALSTYGYDAPIIPYSAWKAKLEAYVSSTTSSSAPMISDAGTPNLAVAQTQLPREEHALLALCDWVTDNLPRDTETRPLDDTNTRSVLRADDPSYNFEEKSRVTEETVGLYLAFMVAIGFIKPPTGGGEKSKRELPHVYIGERQKRLLEKVGRSGGK